MHTVLEEGNFNAVEILVQEMKFTSAEDEAFSILEKELKLSEC